jgi:glycine cleavage system T protein (aminomethyltransferase)
MLTVLKEESQKQSGSVTVTDLTQDVGLVELDGPFAWELLKDQVGVSILGARFLSMLEDQSVTETPMTIFRAGKTGEYGYLLKTAANNVRTLWERLLEAGKDYDTRPCGSAAVDLCKLENRVLHMSAEGRRADSVLELNCRSNGQPGQG